MMLNKAGQNLLIFVDTEETEGVQLDSVTSCFNAADVYLESSLILDIFS